MKLYEIITQEDSYKNVPIFLCKKDLSNNNELDNFYSHRPDYKPNISKLSKLNLKKGSNLYD